METNTSEKVLYEKFYSDPSWAAVEAKILKYIGELEDMSTLNENQEAHHLKAEIKARKMAREKLLKFLQDCNIITRNINTPQGGFK